jgi:hypothetical protein
MKTVKSKFIEKSKELMYGHEELQDFSSFQGNINDPHHISDFMFSNHGEYIGGMAAVILAIINP